MLYFIIRPFTHLGLLAFCRNIYLSNTKSIPKDRPVILACNHPSAFLEPCVMASFMKQPLHFLVRGDFFRHPFYRQLMYSLHLIPIYRSTNADFKDLKKNVSLIDRIGHKLNENITLMILVEGSASVKKGLRPIQKGVARMAFDVYEKYGRDDLEIIPVGANFDYPTQFRLSPMISLGKSIALKDYLTDYQENKSKAIRQLMLDIQVGMRRNIIHVEKEEEEELIEQQLLLYRNNRNFNRFPIIKNSAERLKTEIAIADFINQMDVVEKALLKENTTEYFDQLQQNIIEDIATVDTVKWWQLPLIIFGSPLFLLGTLLNFLPPLIGRIIARKKIEKIQYYIPVAWAISNIFYIFYWLTISIIGLLLLGFPWLLLMLFLPLLGYFSILYFENWENWRIIRKLGKLSRKDQGKLKELRHNCYLNLKPKDF